MEIYSILINDFLNRKIPRVNYYASSQKLNFLSFSLANNPKKYTIKSFPAKLLKGIVLNL